MVWDGGGVGAGPRGGVIYLKYMVLGCWQNYTVVQLGAGGQDDLK